MRALYRTISFLFLSISLFAATLSAKGLLKESARNPFLSADLQKKYYKIEVQTAQFLNRQRSNVNGLIESCRGTSKYSYDIASGDFVFGQNGVLDCQTFTYEGALAAITYLMIGKNEDAYRLLNTYKREFYRPKGDMIGLYTSYVSDVPEQNGLALGIDGDRIHLGPVMWVSIAALQYTAATGDTAFLGFVIDTVRWAQHLNRFDFGDGTKGPPSMGSGWGADWSQVYSTENIVDYYAVLSMLKDIYRNGGPDIQGLYKKKNLGIQTIDFEIRNVLRWLKEVVYDKEEGMFHRGFNEKGVDRLKGLDTVSWTISALGPELLMQMGIDPYRLMEYAEREFFVKAAVEGNQVMGFDFTDKNGSDRGVRVIWLEGTGQQIVAYQVMSRYSALTGRNDKAEEYRKMAVKLSDDLDRIAGAVKLIDSALPYSSIRPREKEIIMTFKGEWEIPRGNQGQWVGSIASTLWRFFAASGFNPLAFDKGFVTYQYYTGNTIKK